MPNTDKAGAIQVAEAIHRIVRGLKIAHTQSSVSQYVTVSLGVASALFLPAILHR
ncbi:MAG: diguanylate cyclase [Kastovskya adunca ATA6-11-RM4]|nr:diguanylate cyclase [Kastovskya adunca ATA6-11-RM4]